MLTRSTIASPIVKMRGVGYYRLDRNVVRENLVVRIENRAALGVDGLLVNMFFSSETGIFVVLDHLQIDQAKRKDAEQPDKSSAYQHATSSAVSIHFASDGLTTGWIASSSVERGRNRQAHDVALGNRDHFQVAFFQSALQRRARRQGRDLCAGYIVLGAQTRQLVLQRLLSLAQMIELKRQINIAQPGQRQKRRHHDPSRQRRAR